MKPGSAQSLADMMTKQGLQGVNLSKDTATSAVSLISSALDQLQKEEFEERKAKAEAMVVELAKQIKEQATIEKEFEKKNKAAKQLIEKKMQEIKNFCRDSGIPTGDEESSEATQEPEEGK
jgi:hypothetical protein